MIAYVKGQLTEIDNNTIIIENNGVGYEIMVPQSILGQLPAIGSEFKAYTYQYVKEDALDLYGFVTKDDLAIFKLLLTVNGIGPKGALSILSAITPDELRIAVLSDDVKKIQSAPGIGNKTAQKLIIELKDKLKLEDVLGKDVSPIVSDVSVPNSARDEAIEALVSLGYSPSESIRAVSSIENIAELDGEQVLKAALKKIAFM